MATQFVNEGEFVEYTPSGSNVTAGEVIVLTDYCAIAPKDILDGVAGVVATSGRWRLTKLAGEAYTQGQKIYWDAGNSRTTTTASSHKLIGVAAIAAASADTEAEILLNRAVSN